MVTIPAWIIYAMWAVAIATAIYTYASVRKMQKKNRQSANQLDGTIADEGVSFSDIAGSPHMYGNNTHRWETTTTPIKSKGGK